MKKTYILNSISKTFLVLALVNSCALLSVSPAKKKADKQKSEQVKQVDPTASTDGVESNDNPKKVIQVANTFSTVLVSTLNPALVPAAGQPGSIPPYLNKRKDNGKLVSGGTILANNICPWKIGGQPNSTTGAYTSLPVGTKPTALNADNYYPDTTGTIGICGHIAVNPSNTLLVNSINPVKQNASGAFVADDSLCAVTSFSDGADITGRRFGSITDVTLTGTPLTVLGLQFDSNIYDCPTSKPVVVKIHFVGYGTNSYDECFSICFTEEVVISPDPYSGGSSICVLSDPVTCISGT